MIRATTTAVGDHQSSSSSSPRQQVPHSGPNNMTTTKVLHIQLLKCDGVERELLALHA